MKSRENRKHYWQEHLKSYYESGLSQREYCRQADIGYWSFNQWKRRIENTQESTALTEVPRKVPNQSSISDNRIIVKLNNEIQISLPASISQETLTTILNSVGEYICK